MITQHFIGWRVMFSKFKIAAVAVFVLTASQVSAATVDPNGPYYNNNSCSTGDVSGGATMCYGTVAPAPTNGAKVNVNGATFYSGPQSNPGSSTTGLFGITTWNEIFAASSGSSASFGSKSGTFTLNVSLGSAVAVILKASNTWIAYKYSSLAAGTYTFDISQSSGHALSNIRIVSTAVVPLPASLPLLAAGFGALVMVGRRRKRA